MPGEIARCILADGAARLIVALTTPAAEEAARRHQSEGAAALALARGTTAGLLLSTLTKDEERVTLQVLGDGPLGGLTVDASSSGRVRAYLRHAGSRLPALRAATAIAPQRLSLAAAVGRGGIVHVVRDLGLRDTFSGETQIVSGEIDDDVEHYLIASEQIDSALACDGLLDGVVVGSGGIAISGGVLIQALPGSAGAEIVASARERLRAGSLTRALETRPATAEELVEAALGDVLPALQVLDRRAVSFFCPCSRDRAASSLTLLGASELRSMILDEGKAEVTCNFCRERYEFDEVELEAIRREATPPSGPPS